MAVTTFDSVWLDQSSGSHTGSGTITSVGDVFTCSVSGGFDALPVGSAIKINTGGKYVLIEKTSGTVVVVDRTPAAAYSAKAWTYFFPALTTSLSGDSDKLIACVTDKYTCVKTDSYYSPILILDGTDNHVILDVVDSHIHMTTQGVLLKQVQSSLLLTSGSAKIDCLSSKLHFVSGSSLLTHGDSQLLLDGDVSLSAGTSSVSVADNGTISLEAGTTSVTVVNNGTASLSAGSSSVSVVSGGAITLDAGTTSATVNDDGDIYLDAGSASVSVGSSGEISLTSGTAIVTIGDTGDITLDAGTTSLVLNDDGDISLDVNSVPGALLIDGTTGVVSQAVEEAVSLKTSYISVVKNTITTIPFASTVFDCASNISVANDTFTPKVDGIYSIDINLTSYHTVSIPTGGAYVICQMYESGTTPAIDMAFGSSVFYDPAPACAKTVSLSWTADLDADTAYKFFFYHNNSAVNFILYAGTTTIDSSIRISKV